MLSAIKKKKTDKNSPTTKIKRKEEEVLTKNHENYLIRFICEYLYRNGCNESAEKLADRYGISVSCVIK